MGLLRSVLPLSGIFGPRPRRIKILRGRAHIEFRDVPDDRREQFREAIVASAARLTRIRWTEVNPHTRRVVIAFEEDAYRQDDLVWVVEEAERIVGAGALAFGEGASDHPSDDEPLHRLTREIAATVTGLGIGAALRMSPIPPSTIALNVSAGLSLLGAVPRLRRFLDDRIGAKPAEHLVNVLSPVAMGLSQRTLSSFVDLVHRGSLYGEARSRQRVWDEREADLCAGPVGAALRPVEEPAEKRPLPEGPIERYQESAWLVSLSAFAVSLAASRSPTKAAASLLVGLPKSTNLGRDVFAAQFAQALADRNVLVLDSTVLRRLDRVDCVVLEGSLVARDAFRLGEVATMPTIDSATARGTARSLFNPEDPLEIRRRASWSVGPLDRLGLPIPVEIREPLATMRKRGALVVGLGSAGALVAIAEVLIGAYVGAEELIRVAQTGGMRVLVSSDDRTGWTDRGIDGVLPAGGDLAPAIRRLQREGRVVCLIAAGASPALSVADCGVGLSRTHEAPPWGADLICRDDLSDARLVLEACLEARKVSRQSVGLGLASASLGAFVSSGGFVNNARRVMRVVNAASLLSMANGARVAYGLARRPLPAPRDPTPWHALDTEAAMERLHATRDGLSEADLAARARPEPKPPAAALQLLSAMADEVINPLSPLLAAGAGLSAVAGSIDDALMVGGVVLLDAVLGGVQRFTTERQIERLARGETPRAVVRRGGVWDIAPASKLVRGDVILLEAGDVVPADCRVLEAVSLEVDASSFTGESLPVEKAAAPSFAANLADRSSMLYEGTAIAAGRATALVVAVGEDTEARRGAASAGGPPVESGVEARLSRLMSLTAPVAGAAGLGLLAIGLLRGRKLDEVVGTAVSMAVAAVPEGLPLLSTAAQLASSKRLAKKGALVRNPRCIEALGRVQAICFDKTGTVTEGRLVLHSISDGETEQSVASLSGELRDVLAVALRATRPPLPDHAAETTDDALVGGATRVAVGLPPSFRRISELSFEARRRYHATVGTSDHGSSLSVKGAPEILLSRCTTRNVRGEIVPLDDGTRTRLLTEGERLARGGLRVLAVAERTLDSVPGDDGAVEERLVEGLTFRGFVAFRDPVRKGAGVVVEKLRRAGVAVLMVTGDHPATAESIAEEIGLSGRGAIMTGAELDRLSDDELASRLGTFAIVARATPSHKVRVVRALQGQGKAVAMAGDGANDAPAIRLADVGIALGEKSTAAARAAADIVLRDERLETILESVIEGRAMWSSVRDAVSILIGGNLGEIGFTMGAGLVDGRPPLNARQLLLVNLLTDVAPAMAVALRPPARKSLEALAAEGPDTSLGTILYRDIGFRAVVTAAGAGGAWITARLTGSQKRARTVGMIALVGTQLGQTLASGEATLPVLLTCAGSAAALAIVVQTPGVSQFFGCTPLGPIGWGIATTSSAIATGASMLIPRVLPVSWRNRPPTEEAKPLEKNAEPLPA
jgi:cation-transporting P-type ATPase I